MYWVENLRNIISWFVLFGLARSCALCGQETYTIDVDNDGVCGGGNGGGVANDEGGGSVVVVVVEVVLIIVVVVVVVVVIVVVFVVVENF